MPGLLKKTDAFAFIMLLGTIVSHGQCSVNLTFDTPGYIVGDVYNNTGTSTPKWGNSAGVLDVQAGVGTNGSAGLISHYASTLTGAPSVQFFPDATAMGAAFSTATTVMSFSFDLKLVNVASASGTLYRIYIGVSPTSSGSYPILLNINADRTVTLKDGNNNILATLATIASDDTSFHTISGTIDFTSQTGTVTVGMDANSTYTKNFASTYIPANYTNYGGFKVNRLTTNNQDVIALDNIQFGLIPEPASIGILGFSGLFLLRQRRAEK